MDETVSIDNTTALCNVASNVVTITDPFGPTGSFDPLTDYFMKFTFSSGGYNPSARGTLANFTVEYYTYSGSTLTLLSSFEN